MRNLKRLLAGATLSLLLIGSLSGCGFFRREVIVLKDREQITPHPTDPDKVCLDKGYLDEIFEKIK